MGAREHEWKAPLREACVPVILSFPVIFHQRGGVLSSQIFISPRNLIFFSTLLFSGRFVLSVLSLHPRSNSLIVFFSLVWFCLSLFHCFAPLIVYFSYFHSFCFLLRVEIKEQPSRPLIGRSFVLLSACSILLLTVPTDSPSGRSYPASSVL